MHSRLGFYHSISPLITLATIAAGFLVLTTSLVSFAQDQTDAASTFALGVQHFKENRIEEALTAFREAQKSEPRNTEILFNLGLVAAKLERFGWALGYWREALRINPWDTRSRNAIEWVKPKLRHADLPRKLTLWDLFKLRLLNWITLAQLLFGTAVSFLISGWLSLRWLGQRRRAALLDEPAPALPSAAAVVLLVFIFLASTSITKTIDSYTPHSTIVAERVEARSARDAAATVIFILSEGHEVIVRRFDGDWAQVTYPGGPTGWIPMVSLYQGRIP